MHRRRALAVLFAIACVGSASACGGSASTLHTLGDPTGKGDVVLDVDNRSGSIVNNLYLAPTEKVRAAPRAALEGGPEQAALWGSDLLSSGLAVGGKAQIPVPGPGQYDVRVVDRDGNEQHIGGLKLAAGGRYVLELGSGSWRRSK